MSPDLAALGRVVAVRREQTGWTLADLAAASGVSRATFSALEHGRQDVTVTRLLAVDRALRDRLRQAGVGCQPLLLW